MPKTPTTPGAALTAAMFALLAIAAPAPVAAQDSAGKDALRVCADPSNLPFSNEAREGFENEIAALYGERLGLPVEYTWLPQQFGFARNTLKRWLAAENRYACDLILSVTGGFEMGKTTLPYYRSTYVLAYVRGRGLDAVKSPADLAALPAQKKEGLVIGGFAGSPPIDWVVQNGLTGQLRSYRGQSGNYTEDPGDMISKDLVNGDIDVALIWGPIGGYYAQQAENVDIEVVPFTAEDGMNLDFPIAMGVRYGNDQWLETTQNFLDENHDDILAILERYNVPLVPLRPEDRIVQEDDDD
jgi:mxaJ protein